MSLCNKVNSKFYSYDFVMKLPKLVRTLLKVGLHKTEVVDLLLPLLILISRNDMEFSFSISEGNLKFL